MRDTPSLALIALWNTKAPVPVFRSGGFQVKG